MKTSSSPSSPPASTTADQNSHDVVRRSPRPSDWGQTKILLQHNWKKDKQKPMLWIAKFLLGPLLFLLYTFGFFLAALEYDDGQSGIINVGNYRLYPGEPLVYPSTIYVSGWNTTFVDELFINSTINEYLKDNNFIVNTTSSDTTNKTEFMTDCQTNLPYYAADGVCVFLDTNNSYTIFFGGSEYAAPWQPALAGAQHVMDMAIIGGDYDKNTLLPHLGHLLTLSRSNVHPVF